MTRNDPLHPLDDVGWSALAGPHARFALHAGSARRYPDGMPPFAALQDDEPAALLDLASLLEPGGMVALTTTPADPRQAGLVRLAEVPLAQMICEVPIDPPERAALALGEADVDAMLALVEATQPGPFGPRSIEMGRYVGYRDEAGALIALAGERLRPAGHTEVSAVCTDPKHQRKGLGEAVVRDVAHAIQVRGDIPFLHVEAGAKKSAALLAFYRRLGFRERRLLSLTILQKPAA
jgi:predicted GNAT family acetyltransferase